MAQKLSKLAVGAKVVDTATKYNGEAITWLIGGHDHYATGQTAMVAEKLITLKAFDALEASNTDSNRKTYGNNRYSVSNIRQWLNSSATTWYSAQHSTDASPNNANVHLNYNEYDAEAGFLTNFSASMRNALVSTTLTVAKNTVTDGSGSETVSDKVFLLSNTEVGLANENSIVEGKLLSLFSTASNRIAKPTALAVSESEYKESAISANGAHSYWLRTPSASYSHLARGVYTNGSINVYNAYSGITGVRPALNISSDVLVSDTTNANGEYEIQWNATPTVSGTDSALGNITSTPTYAYSVNDTDITDMLTIVEKIDGTTTKTIANAVREQSYSFDFSTFMSLSLGDHTATITVSDGQATATRTITFTRADDRIILTGKTPIETSIASTKIVASGIVDLASGATLKIEACNNGFDTSPAWEQIEFKRSHTFANTTKTATKWGVNYRLTVLKNTATSKSYVKAIGISFE